MAKITHLNRQSLYQALSEKGNPTLDTFELILKGLGYRLAIQPEERRKLTNLDKKDSRNI